MIWSINLWDNADYGVNKVDFNVGKDYGEIERFLIILLESCYSTMLSHLEVSCFYCYVGYWYVLYSLFLLFLPLLFKLSIFTPKNFNNFSILT